MENTFDSYYNTLLNVNNANNAWSAEQAQIARDYEQSMSNTAHQREVADLKAAGLNPVLSAGGSGATTTSGNAAQSSGSIVAALGSLFSKMLDVQSEIARSSSNSSGAVSNAINAMKGESFGNSSLKGLRVYIPGFDNFQLAKNLNTLSNYSAAPSTSPSTSFNTYGNLLSSVNAASGVTSEAKNARKALQALGVKKSTADLLVPDDYKEGILGYSDRKFLDSVFGDGSWQKWMRYRFPNWYLKFYDRGHGTHYFDAPKNVGSSSRGVGRSGKF